MGKENTKVNCPKCSGKTEATGKTIMTLGRNYEERETMVYECTECKNEIYVR